MKINYKKVKENININYKNDFLKQIMPFIPEWYNDFLLKASELVPIDEIPNKKYGRYEYKLLNTDENIVFGKLYSFNEMKVNYDKYAELLYPNTIIIGEEMNEGYFFLQTFKDKTYKIGFWDSDQIVPLPPEIDDYDYDNEIMNYNNVYYMADSFSTFLNCWTFVWY